MEQFSLVDSLPTLKNDIIRTVRGALSEDVGNGDITAQLIPDEEKSLARIMTRENCVVCGQAWVDSVFHQLDPAVEIEWLVSDGDSIKANAHLCNLKGKARSLLTGERTALNFLQLLSGVATTCRRYADLVEGTGVKLLDTRKTLPGLRTAQKYAVKCGGCHNHRIGLYDAFLIKENHIAACGGISIAVESARRLAPGKPVEIEVENLEDLSKAIEANADTIMLDNFSYEDLHKAVAVTGRRARLEASGGVSLDTIASIAQTGVDFISIGALTKNCRAIDLSMLIEISNP